MDSLLNYLTQLDYALLEEGSTAVTVRHRGHGQTVELLFVAADANLPVNREWSRDRDYLIVVDEETLAQEGGVEAIEKAADSIPDNAAMIVWDEESLEHTMKDIWFFLTARQSHRSGETGGA